MFLQSLQLFSYKKIKIIVCMLWAMGDERWLGSLQTTSLPLSNRQGYVLF